MKRLWLILFVLPLFAQNETLAIIDFESNGVSTSESKNIVSKIENELLKLSCMQLIERNKIEEVIIEQGFQQSGCTTTDCAVEIGQLLGTDKLLLGSVGKIGRIYTINAKIVSVESGKVLKGFEVISEGGIEELYRTKAKELAYNICGRRYISKPKVSEPIPKRTYTPPKRTYPPPKKYTYEESVSMLSSEGLLEGENSFHLSFGLGQGSGMYWIPNRRYTEIKSYWSAIFLKYEYRSIIDDGISTMTNSQKGWRDQNYYRVKTHEIGLEYERSIFWRIHLNYGFAFMWVDDIEYIGPTRNGSPTEKLPSVGETIEGGIGIYFPQKVGIYYNHPFNKIMLKIGYSFEMSDFNYQMKKTYGEDGWGQLEEYNYFKKPYGGIKLIINFSDFR